MKRARLAAAGLVLPLAAFIGITFAVPVGTMLVRSVYDPTVADAMPQTLVRLGEWDGRELPPDGVYRAAAAELLGAAEEGTLGRVATRINRVQGGLRSVLIQTARQLGDMPAGQGRRAFLDLDPEWGDPGTWRAARPATG